MISIPNSVENEILLSIKKSKFIFVYYRGNHKGLQVTNVTEGPEDTAWKSLQIHDKGRVDTCLNYFVVTFTNTGRHVCAWGINPQEGGAGGKG